MPDEAEASLCQGSLGSTPHALAASASLGWLGYAVVLAGFARSLCAVLPASLSLPAVQFAPPRCMVRDLRFLTHFAPIPAVSVSVVVPVAGDDVASVASVIVSVNVSVILFFAS